jgi:hypothetical protein
MTEERVERRLTAILAADVAGYSRLMGGSLVLVASYAQLGRNDVATGAVGEIRALPGGSAKFARWYLDRYSDPAPREHMAEGLRKAGVLEQ